jgi:phosphoglycolate phosphatase
MHSLLFDASVPTVLGALVAQGVRLGIVSAAPRPYVVVLLERTGIRRFFRDCLVTAETCSRRKPDPAPLRHALALLAHPPEAALYVGDAREDEAASRRAGIHFALAGWARRAGEWDGGEPDVRLDRFSDLLARCRA